MLRPFPTLFAFSLFAVVSCGSAVLTQASLLFDADFSTNFQGFSHARFFGPAVQPGPQATVGGSVSGGVEGRWVASYTETPRSDFRLFNTFYTFNDQMLIEDWGGEAFFESFSIDVSDVNSVDLAGVNSVLGNGADQRNEYFEFFYSVDGGSAQTFDFSSGGSWNVNGLDVSGADSITVGFNFDVNGDSGFFRPDGWSVSTITVTSVSAVPEPSTILFLSSMFLGGGVWAWRRRRRTTPSGLCPGAVVDLN